MRRTHWSGAAVAMLAIAAAVAVLSSPACAPGKGAIMLAVNTDMKAPKDVSVVSLTISTGAQVRYNFIGRVTPDGEVKLPATIAIVEPDDPKATIRIRAIAFQETRPRVLRDIRTTVPRNRTALLRMPLNFVDDGSAMGALPAQFLPAKSGGGPSPRPDGGAGGAEEFNAYDGTIASKCGASDEQTEIDGACADSTIDSMKLPDYRDELVFGAGGACFDAKRCLAGATEVPSGTECTDTCELDLDACTVQKRSRDAKTLNLALMTPDVGECVQPGVCLVPIDQGDGGWKDEGTVLRLAPGLCKKIRGGAKLYESPTCAAKPVSSPVCTEARDGGVAVDGLELFAMAPNPTSLAVVGDSVVYACDDGLVSKSLTDPTKDSVPNLVGQWRFAHDPGGSGTYTLEVVGGATAAPFGVSGGTLSPREITNLAGRTVSDVAYLNGYFYLAAIAPSPLLLRAATPYNSVQALTGNIPQNATALLGGNVGGMDYVVVGDNIGRIQACAIANLTLTCGNAITIADGAPVEALTSGGNFGYAMVGEPAPQIHRADLPKDIVGGITGLTMVAQVTWPSDPTLRPGFVADTDHLYFSTGQGISFVRHGETTATAVPGVGALLSQGVSVLGVAKSPTHLYFAVHADVTKGGGIYRVPGPTIK